MTKVLFNNVNFSNISIEIYDFFTLMGQGDSSYSSFVNTGLNIIINPLEWHSMMTFFNLQRTITQGNLNGCYINGKPITEEELKKVEIILNNTFKIKNNQSYEEKTDNSIKNYKK